MQRVYLDVNVAVGRSNNKDAALPYKVQDLIEEMQYCQIHGALASSRTSKDYSAVKGNTQILDAIKRNERLYGVATILPDLKYELRQGDTYLQNLADAGIRAFKMYPSTANHGFDPFTLDTTAEFLTSRDIPLIVDFSEVNMKDLREVLHEYRDLKILLCGTYWSTNRRVFRLMERYQNLYIEFSSNQANDILDLCKRYFGIERVLFGSDYPNKSVGALKSLVEYSKLSEDDKDKVAAGNAAKLFKIDLNALPLYDEALCELDSIAQTMDKGLPLDDILVIDSHTHMIDYSHQMVTSTPIYNGDEHQMVEKMDALGFDLMVTSPWEGITTTGDDANETALAAKENYPGRIEAYATYNPHYGKDLENVLNYYHRECGFCGIKPYHPHHRFDLLDPCYDKWFEYGDKHSLFALIHSESPDIHRKVEKLSDKYKNLAFIIAHSGISYTIAASACAAAKGRKNVFLEITYTALTNGVIEYMVDEVGAEKVLFGSDMPMRDPAPQLAWVCYAKISEDDKKKILGENMKKLLDRCFEKK